MAEVPAEADLEVDSAASVAAEVAEAVASAVTISDHGAEKGDKEIPQILDTDIVGTSHHPYQRDQQKIKRIKRHFR